MKIVYSESLLKANSSKVLSHEESIEVIKKMLDKATNTEDAEFEIVEPPRLTQAVIHTTLITQLQSNR